MERPTNDEIVCKTADNTEALGENFSKFVAADSSIALIGDLGAGKTTFVKGLARGFGIGENINSPSFDILRIYRGDVTLLHVDAYRLDGSESAANALLLEDFLVHPHCLVVEWPERLPNFLQTCDFRIFFAVDGHCRKITLEAMRKP
ncbi:MAG: tRNA (adenosine(37)-N6)-threonylcarbamoyltransferase complex ATPase subunit type 1 TsaE [Puniceicoccales bacterium]|jgi:tRNA threonylcarbamoyladenosine biosynthesis protein TsaE|nr:tRNA (adenosine(37)-N6)-threonylcarbamoyltransferase complex ATPase subunit type 1 TsaE [Puniceicoccales bacterium]